MKTIISLLAVGMLLVACNNPAEQPKTDVSAAPSEERIGQIITQDIQQGLTPDAVLTGLQDGNTRYLAGKPLSRDLNAQAMAGLEGQFPEAFILSCMDSRVPVEYIFDKGIGDLFVGRVAGNVVDEHMLASMEYACEVSGAKLILVLGHQDCGAVKAAIKGVELGNITSLMGEIKPSVQATNYTGERTYSNKEFANAVVVEHVRQTIDEIRRDSPILKKLEEEDKIKICGAVYEMSTGRVHFL
ncbi:carbonic anhydrase family protein [Porphyromonas sp. COT-290 OH860]|uniref:carbonic anhydrase family protein n=1 Tax=Porphyromonas sp. COT-290 OH860 TaxID=1515615 RepID=UPI00052D00F3|nr:carbonic anhydrase family protein [Porphyromonas sp. COT-290 OH860]KGN86243.1 carbonic anhydrase [Porphyromonas sp. COT-290 OH860]